MLLVALSFAAVADSAHRKMIEADYLLQAQRDQLAGLEAEPVTTQADAAGGCDGVKNGKWGFHTGPSDCPWWQVDLRKRRVLGKVVVWNRCDAAARANHLRILLSDDAKNWRTVYEHAGTTFYGQSDGKPLEVALDGEPGRYVRLEAPGGGFLHLDEVEVYGLDHPDRNLARGREADQISTSQWSTRSKPLGRFDLIERVSKRHLAARWKQRKEMLANPLLDFDDILFTKRVPGSFNHMSDQYIGWWSRPGGGIYILRDFQSDSPREECLTESFAEPGSFLRPTLSYNAKKVLFAWCRYYPNLSREPNKFDKNNVPEDSFYHLFEMNIDGTNVRQLTHGKYNDFDGRYLPDGRIVFLSTRRGHALQVGRASAALTLAKNDLPEAYVRCGGGPERPCAVYTLHTIDGDGGNLCAISPFEMFEWTPEVSSNGTILYSRWDYVDRDNMPYMGLWSMNPDGTNARIVYGNYTKSPHCTFEPRPVPGSHKIIMTASGHHAQTMGSLVLLDPTVGTEGADPITRLTPEVVFPEIEGWPTAYYANPWPLSESLYLVSWGVEKLANQGKSRSENAMALYLFDEERGRELLYRDALISCMYPIPLRPRPRPHVIADVANWDGPQEGTFLLLDVYQGLKTVQRGDVKALRIVAVPPKTHPTMDFPNLGITKDDPGKCVLGTVPVEADGSAYFRVPSGVIVFFQALDANGMAIQTMRSATYVQPGQRVSCVGCHESRTQAPATKTAMAAGREPSKIATGPEGSWPLRFDRLVQPILDEKCMRCHGPRGNEKALDKLNLAGAKAYEALVKYGKPSLFDHVWTAYRRGYSIEGQCAASQSALLEKLNRPNGHHGVKLDAGDLERLITWMDTYAQRLGTFDDVQEQHLRDLREQLAGLLVER